MTEEVKIKRVAKVAVQDLAPNRWNPNRESEFVLGQMKESLMRWGMVTPPVVRARADGFDIINGEHRWRIWVELGNKVTPVDVIEMADGSPVPDHVAQRLSIMLNVHGEPDDSMLAELLAELSEVIPPDEMEWLYESIEDAPSEDDESREPWETLKWEVPASVSLVVMEAIRKAKGEDAEWMGLERIAADYLASP